MAGMIHASERTRRQAARTAAEEKAHALGRLWGKLRRSLSGPRGVWSDESAEKELHWKLDKFEDPSRRLPAC